MHYLNDFILQVLQHGLFNVWEDKMILKYDDYKIQTGLHLIAAGKRMHIELEALTVVDIYGALFVLLMGIGLGFLALLIEIFMHRIWPIAAIRIRHFRW